MGWPGRIDPATAPRAEVGVLIPMMTLLGLSEDPASLEGYGPIDVDRTTYRPPADLKRWLALRDATCRFPGCGRSARFCDIDHTTGWAEGGVTSADNLGHLSKRHHTVKTESPWKVEQREPGRLTWTSPTGAIRTTDPPPF
jgi:hypothetical protein